jgi:hypothetical protein
MSQPIVDSDSARNVAEPLIRQVAAPTGSRLQAEPIHAAA